MQEWPPPSVERLLGGALGSVGSVELLLLLRAAGDGPRRLDELSGALQSPRSWTERELRTLAAAGLIRHEEQAGWRYAPATSALGEAVSELARAWRLDSRVVSRWVFAPSRRRPPRRLRT